MISVLVVSVVSGWIVYFALRLSVWGVNEEYIRNSLRGVTTWTLIAMCIYTPLAILLGIWAYRNMKKNPENWR